jgi:hypothetical protein
LVFLLQENAMAVTSSRTTARPAANSAALAAVDWTNPMFATFVEAQLAQWNAALALQQSLATFHRDLWEQWACRFAGGIPLDA